MSKFQRKSTSFIRSNVASQHNVQIDVLRGLAILGVLAAHVIVYTDLTLSKHGGTPSSEVNSVISAAKYGVEVFFFVSGYLMQALYGIDKPFSLKSFFCAKNWQDSPPLDRFSHCRLESTKGF